MVEVVPAGRTLLYHQANISPFLSGQFCTVCLSRRPSFIPIVAKVGGLQSQGVKGEAVIPYRNPLTTQDLKFSGFTAG